MVSSERKTTEIATAVCVVEGQASRWRTVMLRSVAIAWLGNNNWATTVKGHSQRLEWQSRDLWGWKTNAKDAGSSSEELLQWDRIWCSASGHESGLDRSWEVDIDYLSWLISDAFSSLAWHLFQVNELMEDKLFEGRELENEWDRWTIRDVKKLL